MMQMLMEGRGAELLACLQVAIGISVFGQGGHTRLNGSREM